ncbi:MAG: transposase [Desulfovibrionaceae bacterium]|nr:transposase [Desulfovibrionaceae bacterium]
MEDGATSIFTNVVVQRCVVHMIRNLLKYIQRK